jgi:CBS domain containing-hemolysin-like protein
MVYRLFILAAIIGVNAFFAAAEVALVSVRRSRLRTMAERGNAGAQAALSLLARPERLLSVTQVGVTLASLALGWAGEPTFDAIITRLLGPLATIATAPYLHAVSFTLAFVLMTWAHVVIGEVVPKNLAMEKADRLALLVAPVLLLVFRVSEPFVFVIERSAMTLSRALGLRGSGGGVHSAEELKFIISLSRAEGHLHQFEEDAIQSLLELQNYNVREIMTPRNAIASVSAEATLDQVLRIMRVQKYSRVPVYEGRPEHIVGFVHIKDLLGVLEQQRIALEKRRQPRAFHLRSMLRKHLVAPETKPLNELVDEFRGTHTHMAMVVDEFGTISGLVTLEDVLEQVFGEIGDEHDVKRPAPRPDAPLDLDGTTLIRDLDTQYQIELPADAGFETLAGFLLFRMGDIPKEGDAVEYAGRRFTITRMIGNRIARVRIEKVAGAGGVTELPARDQRMVERKGQS